MGKKAIIPFFLLLFMSPIRLTAEETSFTIEPASIVAGSSITLTWNASGATHVYISSLGEVSASGSLKVSPHESTNYTMLIESPTGITLHSGRVIVSGARGSGFWPDSDQFNDEVIQFKVSSNSLISILAVIRQILQDQQRFSLKESMLPGERYVFLTSMQERPDLIRTNERTIGARRLAFLVEVEKERELASEYRCTIKISIESRRRIEATWRNDRPEGMAHEQAQLIRNKFEVALSRIQQSNAKATKR